MTDVPKRIVASASMLWRPGSVLAMLLENPRSHMTSSVVICAIVVCLSLYPPYPERIHAGVHDERDWWDDAAGSATGPVHSSITTILIFAVVFYAGRRLGGTREFARIFVTLSHCLIPIIAGMAIVMITTEATYWYFYGGIEPGAIGGGPGEMYDDGTHDAGGPVYALDVPGYMSMLPLFAFLPFMGWSVALSTRAVMFANGFGVKKSLVIIALSVGSTYLASIMYGVAVVTVIYLSRAIIGVLA